MTVSVQIKLVERSSNLALWASSAISRGHYLHKMPDPRTSYEIALIYTQTDLPLGALVFNRTEATRCYPWYGSVDDVRGDRSEVTRWQVLNLARVYIDPKFQRGGVAYNANSLPGFVDRLGKFRSTLASQVIQIAGQTIGYEYLLRRPPVFLDEPYEINWLLSYCDTRLHRGTIYQAAGFERYRVNANGIETWRRPLPTLTSEQHAAIALASQHDVRARILRGRRMGEQHFTQATFIEDQIDQAVPDFVH